MLGDEIPFLLADFVSEKLLEAVDTLAGNERVDGVEVRLVELATVHGLVGTFDLDGDRGLSLFADGDLFVFTLNRDTVDSCQHFCLGSFGHV